MLDIVKKTLDCFHEAGIIYCHFKSNEHVDAAVDGDTDLDILFDYNKKDEVLNVLGELGYVECKTNWFVSYPYVKDFIAISDGKIIHIHAHFKLILGESKVKSYVLPWEQDYFKSRVFMQDFNIYASNPSEEALLLLIRMALKLPSKSLGYGNKRDTLDAVREFQWLKGKITKEQLIDVFRRRFPGVKEKSLDCIYDDNISYDNISAFYGVIKENLNKYRRYSFLKSKFMKFSREMFFVFYAVNRKFQIIPSIVNHRVFPKSGLIVALMGADGSGKSTQTRIVTNILNKKIDARYIYMGSGVGKASWHRYLLNKARKVFERSKSETAYLDAEVDSINVVKKKSSLREFFKIIYCFSLAIEKRCKLTSAEKFRRKGMVVITDRYPQNVNCGYNDGPMLTQYLDSRNIFYKWISHYECDSYNKCYLIAPDLVIKLMADPEVLYDRRKDEMTLDRIMKKQNGINDIDYGHSTSIAVIDASLPVEKITLSIVNHIGILISQKNRLQK